MAKRLTKEEYLKRLKKVHPNYDVSHVDYKNLKSKITLICEHGHFFEQRAEDALIYGCPICNRESKKKLVFGFGVNDLCGVVSKEKCYPFWILMLRRCYDEKYLSKRPTYKKCYVDDNFKYLSKFKKWFDENYIEGYHLDKDILSPIDDVHYSPETCCFVPLYINELIKSKSKEKLTGVEKRGNKYIARHNTKNGIIYLGTFETEDEAMKECVESREKYIREVALYAYSKNDITIKVYEALCKYKVIHDD